MVRAKPNSSPVSTRETSVESEPDAADQRQQEFIEKNLEEHLNCEKFSSKSQTVMELKG